MKKFLTLFAGLFLVYSISIFSQDFARKGTVELGGSLGFNSTTSVFNGESSDESITSIFFNPYVGYFIINSFEIGIIPSYSTFSFGDQSSTHLGILLAPAYNFDLGNCWYPFLEGRVGYNTSSSDDGNDQTEDPSSSGLQWGFRGGVKAQVGGNALINAGLFYNQITMDPEDWDGDRIGQNVFGIEVGVAIFLY